VNIYPVAKPTCTIKTRVSHAYPDKDTADANAKETRIDCQEIKVKVRREKVRPVERSVTVKVRVNSGGDPFSDPDDQNGCPFHNHPETYGKRGVLTFTWQEDPPKC
jgi:hypothetical protein